MRLPGPLLALLVASSALPLLPARADYMDHFVLRSDVGPHKVPYLGPAEVVLIPVEVAGHPPLDRAALVRFFSDAHPQGFTQFYKIASLGRYAPKVTIAPTVHYESCPLPLEQFPECRVARGDYNALLSGMEMMRDIIRRADALGVDFSAFDVNGAKGTADGWADGVMILSNTPFGGIAFPFGYYNTGDNLAGGKSGPMIVDRTRIPHLAIAGEADVHTMVHEFGHLLGLTDLYDESRKYRGLHYSFMGAGGFGENLSLPDAETRYRLRWGRVRQVSGTQKIRVLPAESSGEMVRLGSGSEYFLVENRGPGEFFDRGMTTRGLVVFHVDRTVKLRGEEGYFQSRILDCVNCDPYRPYIRLIQADGRFQVEGGARAVDWDDLFLAEDSLVPDPTGEPFSTTYKVNSSNWYSGEVSGIRIEEITIAEDGSITAIFTAPETDTCADPLCAEGVGCKAISCPGPAMADEAPKGCATAGGGVVAWLVLSVLGLRRRRTSRGEAA